MKPTRHTFRCLEERFAPSLHTMTVLGEIARSAGIPEALEIVITGGDRTPREQACAMLDHVLALYIKQHGEEAGYAKALALYGEGGKRVIRAMQEAREHGLGRESVLDLGEAAVIEAEDDGYIVSRHRPNALVEARDLSRTSLGLHVDAFAKHAMGHPQVRKVVHDNALHIEVYKPGRRA